MPRPPSGGDRRGRPGQPPKPGSGRRDAPKPAGARRGTPPGKGGKPPAARRGDKPEKRQDPKIDRPAWGGVARRGAAQVRRPDDGKPSASSAFREAVERGGGERWEPEQWIDEGVRTEATHAVERGHKAPKKRSGTKLRDLDTSLSPRQVAALAVPERLQQAGRAFRREHYDEARRLVKPIVDRQPGLAEARELLGLVYYRTGRWKDAVRELEAFRAVSGSTEQHPVLADCYRALNQHSEVEELWDELRQGSPSAELVAEGRIVSAHALADRGEIEKALKRLEPALRPVRVPRDHHLRQWYALADLYERAGDLPKARQLFARVAAADGEFADVAARIRSLR